MPTTPPPAGWQWARQGQWARDLSREGRGTAAPAARRPGPDSRSAPQSPATEAAGASARRLVCASNEVSCRPGVCLQVCVRLRQNSQLRCQEPLGRRAPTLRSTYKMHILGGNRVRLLHARSCSTCLPLGHTCHFSDLWEAGTVPKPRGTESHSGFYCPLVAVKLGLTPDCVSPGLRPFSSGCGKPHTFTRKRAPLNAGTLDPPLPKPNSDFNYTSLFASLWIFI